MLHVSEVPHSAMSRQSKEVMFLGKDDKQHNEVIYCPSCGAPVVNSAFGIRRHLIQTNGTAFWKYEDSRCEQAFKKLGYNSNGQKTTTSAKEANRTTNR